ncbi:hypothetical protein I4U23_008705 [Adineta vaga]|nr:hypothetical protein I4U23_008705 [Adineta vaga]
MSMFDELPFTEPVKSKYLGPCYVCGDNASGINFAVPTCAPCKAFFRRNAVKLGKTEFICQQDGDCPVTFEHRRMCNCCRLAKCFRVGMQKSLILSDAEKQARRILILQNRLKRVPSSPSNEFDLIRPSNLLRTTFNQSKHLCVSDQTLLTNIFSAYERTCIATRITSYPYYPTKAYSSLHMVLNEYSIRQKALIEYFKLVPDFDRLSMDDKVRLIKNHFGSMFSINERICNDVISESSIASIRNLFEPSLATDFIHSIERISIYAHDPMLLEVLLIVRTLSSGMNRYLNDAFFDGIYDDTHAIFIAQNRYIELLWRYILYRTSTEQDAIKFFNKLVLNLLFLQCTYSKIGYYVSTLKDEIDQLDPLMQSMWPRVVKNMEIKHCL